MYELYLFPLTLFYNLKHKISRVCYVKYGSESAGQTGQGDDFMRPLQTGHFASPVAHMIVAGSSFPPKHTKRLSGSEGAFKEKSQQIVEE